MTKSMRSKLFKNSMSMDEVVDQLKNITSPVMLEVLGKAKSDGDRSRIIYPNGYVEYSMDRWSRDFQLPDSHIENNLEYNWSCFMDNTSYDKYELMHIVHSSYKFKKIDRLQLLTMIVAMLTYDYKNDLRIINIVPL